MPAILNHPENLLAFIFAFGILGNFWLAGRELAIQASLQRNGIVGEASIIDMFRSRGWPWITYKYFDPNSDRYFQRNAFISHQRYRQSQIGDAVNISMLVHHPHISRLTDNDTYGLVFFVAGAVTLIFPIYFLGWGCLFACLLFILAAFVINWLWINFRPI